MVGGKSEAEQEEVKAVDKNQVVAAQVAFACDLFQQLAGNSGNICVSPFSIGTALAMTYAGAEGRTATEMATVLRFPGSPGSVHPAMAELLAALRSDVGDAAGDKIKIGGDKVADGYELSIANRLWAEKDQAFVPRFLEIGRKYYGAEVGQVDFRDEAEAARLAINDWVADQTHNRIEDLMPAGSITSAR